GIRFDGEAPSPFPGAKYPLGYPVTLKYNGAGTVAFTAGRLAQNGQAVPAVAAAGTGFITRNTYMVAATAPLLPGTAYTVMIEGTLNGQPFSRTWGFTTKGTPPPPGPPAPQPTPPPAPAGGLPPGVATMD